MLLLSNASIMKGFSATKKCAEGFREMGPGLTPKPALTRTPPNVPVRGQGVTLERVCLSLHSAREFHSAQMSSYGPEPTQTGRAPHSQRVAVCCFCTHVNGRVGTKAKSQLAWKPCLQPHSKQICRTIILYLEIHLSFRGHF